MRLIDSDALMERMKEIYTDADQRTLYSEIWRVASHAPAIDAVPVVRCKECKMWNTEWKHEAGDCYCYKFFQFTDPDFFCAAGERRDSDE